MKKWLLISGGLLLIVSGIYYICYSNENRVVLESDKTDNNVNTNFISMMYETESGSGEYTTSSDSAWPQDGYIFNAELSSCENGSKLTWNDETKQVLLEANVSDKCYVYFDKEPDIIYFADYIVNNVYTGTDGDNGLYYHDGTGSYTNADQEAGDNSYRFAGANPNNFVCFGSDDATCPNDNLYRIIGVFDDKVKLIKYDYADSSLLGTDGGYMLVDESTLGISFSEYINFLNEFGVQTAGYKGNKEMQKILSYMWSDDSYWSSSDLNKINLNQNYLTNIGSKWAELIAINSWLCGIQVIRSDDDIAIAGLSVKNAFLKEVENPENYVSYDAKIGLMYVSDYGYAASPENWTTELSNYGNYTNINNNWMFMSGIEWTISSYVTTSIDYTFIIMSDGAFASFRPLAPLMVRPSFYLNSDVQYVSGDGSLSNPYRIA